MEEDDKENGAQSSFRAFISYSHADARLVRKLHSQLEAYRLPKGLGEISAQNALSHGLGKIFRDREYLSVAQDLSSTVKDALVQSEVLLVVCSPNAKGSHWVEREIQYFRNFHPDRPILAALVEGEPGEAFPLALTEGGMEPLAADLRKEGDGWKLGFLKLVAGIVGVPLDALVQRDSQRQTTRVMAVTGVVGFFALCMMAMAFVAIQARNEAQFQQGQAEEFVGYLVGDLRTELRGVGRLDVMRKANERALAYYQAQEDLGALSPETLSQRARVLHAIGEDELTTIGGDHFKAGEIFAEAFRGTEAGLRENPSDPKRIFDHAQSNFWLGNHAYDSGDWDSTETFFQAYRELSAQMYRQDETDLTALVETGYAEGNLCTLELKRDGDMQLARERCTESLKLFQEARRREPNNAGHIVNIANRYAWLADALVRTGSLIEARRERLKGELLAQELREREPENKDWQYLWLSAQISLAQNERELGLAEEARKRLQQALPVSQALSASDPENGDWKSQLEKITELGGNYVK
ncbi:MAG: toll/interleukin-1 receptor domain-containing protein [Erythrobacter sp.]|uniref:toll/interleukin-1 receptor domain-containing protein n=1 Tax=Erythrobacter sp. TaxID=1042 RepID=UPI0032664B93